MGGCLSSSDASDDLSEPLHEERSQSIGDSRAEDSSLYQPTTRLPVYHLTPSVARNADQLTEQEQVKIIQRICLIQQLPTGIYDGNSKKLRECIICMGEFEIGDKLRFLPCMHQYHVDCIDDWLMRSLTCPQCTEPVDAGLLLSYDSS